uniref:DNA-directed primase/polymerase protein n=1 Tax=Oryzias sinensis TaxID=183150 RepID=A0A8C7Y1I6_9TELE
MSKWGDRLKKVELLAQTFQSNPLTARYKPRLWPCEPSSVWRLFPRQSMAVSFVRSCKETVHVFALEKERESLGQRIFLVTSYSELWHYYKTYPQSLMHCYEVIPEGAVCKLYFDLEFHKPSNRGSDGESMVLLLIKYVCEKLLDVYGIECSEKNVLNLDSSTEEKFSRHLIFLLQHAAFKDNIHVGTFTAEVDGGAESPPIKRCKALERDLSFLLIKNKEGKDGLFVDLGVYTKNRNFRLYKSSKVGKNAAFTVAEDNKFIPQPEKGISAEQSIFLASLVCNLSFTGQTILTWSVPETSDTKISRSSCPFWGCSVSPYPEVDTFVLNVVKKEAIQGSIRRWNYFAAEQLLVYDIAKYRWCENVGRFHKSNNIMIVVDLKEEVWYQKCHDPDCRNFRSSSYPLPQEICISYILNLDEEDRVYLMDEAGNFELSQVPNQGPRHREPLAEEAPTMWGDDQEDREFSESLTDFEQNFGEISDQLLLTADLEDQ